MGAPQKADWREERRKRAWELKQAGWSQKEIAEALGVTEGAVSQWMKSVRERGEEALKAHPAKGARPRLTAEQQAQIPSVLAKGASAYGFAGDVWNSRRLAVAIKREFGVKDHPDHCGYLVRKLGYSMQKPVTRASQRNEQAIRHGKVYHWPRLKKARQEQRTLVFVAEAGFYLLPMVVRTYARRGQPPVLRVPLTRDHLSAIGSITQQGRLFMQMQERTSKAEDVVRFLQMLLRKIPGKLLVIWDGSPIHRADAVKPFLASPMGKRVHLERLPGYAPELNPQEQVWNLLKRRELRNLCCQNLTHLRRELVHARERLRHRQEILQHCFAYALAEISLFITRSITLMASNGSGVSTTVALLFRNPKPTMLGKAQFKGELSE